MDNTESAVEGLKPYVLLGGYTAAELWWTTNFILPGYVLCLVAPRWNRTPSLTLVGPILHSAIYSLSVLSLMMDYYYSEEHHHAPDMSTLGGIVEFFEDPSALFAGWIHFGAFDCLVVRWIVLDSVARGCSVKCHLLAVVPVVLLSAFVCPMGWLIYIAVVRTFVLPVTEQHENAATKAKRG